MANNEYTITLPNGLETTVRLSEEEAKVRGLKPVEPKAKTATNKARTAANKSTQPADKKD